MVKIVPANAEDVTEAGSISGWGRSPGGAHGNPLSILAWRILQTRGTWQAAGHRIAQSRHSTEATLHHTCKYLELLE